ncbi:MAG: hypothetical protein IJM50_07560 [Lachnospiraceae bacterium]|nr:hypothetical protein [Lachnospiraceae bacterium]
MSEKDIKTFLSKNKYPVEDADCLCSAFSRLKMDGDAFERLSEKVEEYQSVYVLDSGTLLPLLKEVSERTGIHEYTVSLLFFILLMPHLRALYRQKEIPSVFYKDFEKHLRASVTECRRISGICGIRNAWWYLDFYRLKLFSIGRLQYRWRRFKKTAEAGGLFLQEGTYYADVHIPPGAPLTKTACALSYSRAADFFRSRFHADRIIFCCHSWLLSPDLKKILPEDSNILRFSKDYTVWEMSDDSGDNAAAYIFHLEHMPDCPEELPEQTSLQRSVKKLLQEGKSLRIAKGAMLWPANS